MNLIHKTLSALLIASSVWLGDAFAPQQASRRTISRHNWLRDFFEPPTSSVSSRQVGYPEQYPATFELNDAVVPEDDDDAQLIRPLLKNTQLESRPLQVVYDANRDGWNPTAFHQAVDGLGAAIVVAQGDDDTVFGGYNPKGWASLGGARPSVAAFLFYEKKSEHFQKLRKIGGGGMACARDDPNFGISFGPDGLIIGLGEIHTATSRLGTYYECGPENKSSLFSGGVAELCQLKVLVGVYEPGEDVPYSGGVMDCPQPGPI